MRIAFALPATFALDGPGSGVRVQADAQADALAALGHDVTRLDAWRPLTGEPYDVLQFFSGGLPFYGVEKARPAAARVVVFAPIIDTNQANGPYRLAAWAGNVLAKVKTIPGEFRSQALYSDVVVCRSRFEQDRVVRGLGVPVEKTAVVLNGVTPPPPGDAAGDAAGSAAADATGSAALARSVVGFDGPFVLHVSAYCQPRKNVVRLIEAVGPTKIPLVIAGSVEDNDVARRIDRLTAEFPTVRRLGFLDAATLNAVQAACRVFALPSEHEGTGLAALEAAAHGAAVVITERGGARDYFADQAAYVDPDDVNDIRRAVQAAFAAVPTRALADRVRSRLTWADSARHLEAAYRAALARRCGERR